MLHVNPILKTSFSLVLKIGALCKDLCASIKNEAEGNLRWLETIKQQAIDIQNSIKEELK
jgi:hypothetical protein